MLCTRFDLANGRLVLVFFVDSVLPVSSIALLPVELHTFEKCGVSSADDAAADDAAHHNVNEAVDHSHDDSKTLQQQPEKTRFVGRQPFSSPPLPHAAPPSRAGESAPVMHKSFMLMVGYNQVLFCCHCFQFLSFFLSLDFFFSFILFCFLSLFFFLFFLSFSILMSLQPDTHLRLVRVCQPTSAPTFVSGSHSHVMRCASDDLKRFYNRLMVATDEINRRSFAAAIFQAGMCRSTFPDHPNVKNLFSILAENTRKV